MNTPGGTWKPQPWVAPVTVVCLVLGALVALLLRVSAADAEGTDALSMRQEQLAMLYTQLKQQNAEMEEELAKIRKDKDDLIAAKGEEQKFIEALHNEIIDLRIRTGAEGLDGPGIVITIDDSKVVQPNPANIDENALLTHDVDLLLLVNELRAAGAEGIALNDQRVVGSSAIRCVGPVINVNNRPISAPFVVKAVGKPDTLFGAVNLPFGVLDQLKQLGIKVEAAKRDKISLPALTTLPPVTVGKPPAPTK